MGWGTGKGSEGDNGRHSGKKDFGAVKPSKDGAKPDEEPKHKKKDKE